MKKLSELSGDLNKAFNKEIKKMANDTLNKCLSSLEKEISQEKGSFKLVPVSKGKKIQVQIIPEGFSEELTLKIKKLLPEL